MGWARPILPAVRRRRGGTGRPIPSAASQPGLLIATRPASRVLVDANTRTFWSRGAEGPVTLVESDAPATARPLRDRVRALVAAHDRGSRRGGTRPSGNPAFSEALFVELIRGGQHARAFALLAPECQLRWGSAERFAAAHGEGSLQSAGERQRHRRPPPGRVGRPPPRRLPPSGRRARRRVQLRRRTPAGEARADRAPGRGGGSLALPLLPGGGGRRLLTRVPGPQPRRPGSARIPGAGDRHSGRTARERPRL